MAPHGVRGIDNPVGPQPPPSDIVVVSSSSSSHEKVGCGRKITNRINGVLENTFAKLGFVVATHPWKTIAISLSVCVLCMTGILEYEVENRGEKNWVSQSSDAIKHMDWVSEHFPDEFRTSSAMLESKSGNILTAAGLLAIYDIDERARLVANGTKHIQWEDICYRSANVCIPQSILELWSYNRNQIMKLTETDILNMINMPNLISPMTKKPFKPELVLGGPVVRNMSGQIVKAAVAKISFKIKKQDVFSSSKGRKVDDKGDTWEELFQKEMEKGVQGSTLYYLTTWGREDAVDNAAQDDLQFFVVGYILVIIYLSLMLGSFSRINHKFYVAIAGIMVIGLSVGVAYGLGSAFQMKKTAIHDVLAFLLLGIGVDDIFVIVQNWDNIGGPIQDGRSVPEKMSLALKHAGVSILVTSVTDVCAFFIGSSTILPALQSFCIWCGVGILYVFFLTITFFTACLSIDARRQEKRRDACCCCITLGDNWEPMPCSKKSYLKTFMKNYYAKYLLSVPGKVIGIIAVLGLLSGGAVGLAKLEQNFDFDWFLPPSSAPRQYTDKVDVFFPSSGFLSGAYTGKMDYFEDHATLDKIYKKLTTDRYVASGSVESWYHQYHKWLNATYVSEVNVTNECMKTVTACKPANESRYYVLLRQFLNSKHGSFYKNFVNFPEDKEEVQAAIIRFRHVSLSSSSEEIDALDSLEDEIKPISSDSEHHELLPFVYSRIYINWNTNKVISKELFRNILLATLCVFIVTLFLLSHLWTSLLVVLCVALALIDIAGYMHFWNLTVDTVTTIIMVLAIGLTVDYSAHIAHAFMVAKKGDKNERMAEALSEIGPAVVHGGVSTLLAMLLLAASESYIFFTFFKVFFLVVCIGMFHGLVFLPILLSLVGPKPYDDVFEETEEVAMETAGTNKRFPTASTTTAEPGKKMEERPETFITISRESAINSGFTLE